MGINTNSLSLGSSIPAKGGFQADQHADAGDTAASGIDLSGSSSAGQKGTGPSAQTRGNARTAQPRSAATGSAATQVGTDPQDCAAQPSANFGSVMASALGHSAAATTDGSASATTPATAAPAKDAAESATNATPAAQVPALAPDAMAWLAQTLMPPVAAPQPVADAPEAADVTGPAASPVGSAPGGSAAKGAPLNTLPADLGAAPADAQTQVGLAAQFIPQGAATTGPSVRTAANAIRSRVTAEPVPQSPTAPATDAQTPAPSAATPGGIIALAEVQKLISGFTGADSADTDPDTDSNTPATHAAGPTDSTDAAQAAAALQASTLSRPPGSLGAATLTVHAPVGSAAFADEVGARVTGLAQSGLTQAQLQLNPTDLGPVQVHITLQAGQASVWFGATHADTRAALEQSLPRLRELFAGAGMPLTDSGVFREPPQQQQAQAATNSGANSDRSEIRTAPTVTQVANIRLSLLDTYA